MAKVDPTKKPETNRLLELKTAFEQLSSWLGGTKEEIEEIFNVNEIVKEFKPRKPMYIAIDPHLNEDPGQEGAFCEILDEDNWVMSTRLIWNLNGQLRITSCSPRL